MAKMESMVPHILRWEVGLKKEERGLPPRQMYEAVASHGYHVVKGDSGGPTMCGVIIDTFAEWRRRQGKPLPTIDELKRLSYDEWLQILKSLFWDPCKADLIVNASVAMMLVDWTWVNGPVARKQAQRALGVSADGIIGPRTLVALNAAPAVSVFTKLRDARLRSYDKIVAAKPGQMRFYNGWCNRTNSIKFS